MNGNVRLEHSAKNNEYYAYDEHGFICGTLGCNKEKLEQMIKECNEHSELLALNRDLVKVIERQIEIMNEFANIHENYCGFKKCEYCSSALNMRALASVSLEVVKNGQKKVMG